jgi:hypothetical protein
MLIEEEQFDLGYAVTEPEQRESFWWEQTQKGVVYTNLKHHSFIGVIGPLQVGSCEADLGRLRHNLAPASMNNSIWVMRSLNQNSVNRSGGSRPRRA